MNHWDSFVSILIGNKESSVRRYILRRLFQSLFVMLGVLILVFIVGRMVGDPVRLILGVEAKEEQIERLREDLGLNDPLIEQFWDFIQGVARGDFGESFWQDAPALPLVLERIPRTLYLAASTMALAVPLGVILGCIAALKPASAVDRAVNVLSLAGVSVVDFWLALMLILIVAVELRLLPTSGFGGLRGVKFVILPALTLAARPMGRIAQVTRCSVMDELGSDYVKMARAKGLSERRVVFLHALKNAFIPIITLAGDETTSILNGMVLVETIFGWPGVGQMLVQALTRRDLPVVEALIFMVSATVIVVNLLVDVSYAYLNPRIRYGEAN